MTQIVHKQFAAAALPVARARANAWCQILEAVADMRDRLAERMAKEDPNDFGLKADIRTWRGLADGLCNFLEARGVS